MTMLIVDASNTLQFKRDERFHRVAVGDPLMREVIEPKLNIARFELLIGYVMRVQMIAIVASISALLMASMSGSVQAQQVDVSPAPPFVRTIASGDWDWSAKTTKDDKTLFVLANGSFRYLEKQCPNLISASEGATVDTFFAGSWVNKHVGSALQSGNILMSLAELYGSAAVQQSQGRADTEIWMKQYSCSHSEVSRFSKNLVRFLSGRRPLSGQQMPSSTLMIETQIPMSIKHQYPGLSDRSPPQGAMKIERDLNAFAQYGAEILECHYDLDTTDEYYNVQYYWGINAVSRIAMAGGPFSHLLIQSKQDDLLRINGNIPALHPFLTYGPPMFECPSNFDQSLHSREIYKPRESVERDGIPTPEGPPDPEVTKHYTIFNYGDVPDDYVPPIPANYQDMNVVILNMKKLKIGALTGISVMPLSYPNLPPYSGAIETIPRNNKVISEDVFGGVKSNAYFLACTYYTEKRGKHATKYFWLGEEYPIGLDPARLTARLAEHPLLMIHRPVQHCPENETLAGAVVAERIAALSQEPTWPVDEPLPLPDGIVIYDPDANPAPQTTRRRKR